MTLNSTNASLIAVKYLVLNDNQYELHLSKTEAINLGISPEDYDRILDEIAFTNEKIEEHLANTEETLVLIDPQADEENIEVEEDVTRLKTRSESGELRGTITTSGQEIGYGGGFAPLGTKEVTFNCIFFGAILPFYNLTTKAQGEVRTGGGTGLIGKNSVFTVMTVASNTSLTVSFQTSDSNGGKCVWNCH